MRRILSSLAAATALLTATALQTQGAAGARADSRNDSFVIRAGHIVTADAEAGVINDGIIIVRNGIIEAVGSGSDIDIPRDLPLLDLPDATIMPGIVAAQSGFAGAHSGDESISAAYRAIDSFDRYGDFRSFLRSGVTTVHLNPGWHRLVAGQGAIVKLGGDHNARIISDAADLTINFGPAAFNPPDLMTLLIPPSGDQPIEPSKPQRPSSRIDQYLALTEAVAAQPDGYNMHMRSFQDAWTNGTRLRVQAQHVEDLQGAIAFIKEHKRDAYLVGGIEAVDLAEQLRESGLPLVYTIDAPIGTIGRDLGNDPEAIEGDTRDLAQLNGIPLALALTNDQSVSDLRLAAATARAGGLDDATVIAAITRVPAEILGIADRVGSLAPGKAADLLVISGNDPLAASAHVERVFVDGRQVFLAPELAEGNTTTRNRNDASRRALVVRAGSIWLGPDDVLVNGSILIEDGRIAAVGRSIPHPPGARVIDAGPNAFITPGFIDAYGHLGLEGDRGAPGPNISLSRLIGVPDLADLRVARRGVTSVMLAPYSIGGSGAQVSAVKTAGNSRDDRVVAATAAYALSVRGVDPKDIPGRLESRLEAGRKYLEKWQKYEKDLAEWEKKRAEGKLDEAARKPQVEAVEAQARSEDPLTGTWQIRIFGGPLPVDFEGTVQFKLTGSAFEARITDPVPPVEVRITGTLDGKKLTGTIDVDTGGMGSPTFTGELTDADVMSGTVGVQAFSANFSGRRTDKSDVEFKVERGRRRTTGKDGRPLPPPIDDALEPVKAALLKEIPIVVDVSTWMEVDAVLTTLVDKNELNVVLLNAEDADMHAARLIEKNIGVVTPTRVMRERDQEPYNQADDLSRSGVRIAFQSDAEDAARTLPRLGLYAVERGLSPEAALAAMTVDAARMYQVEDRIGCIAKGCDGDLVIFSGHPFQASSAVLRVIVNGEEVPGE
ncbi:MAG: amidohydrolase family protein [Phycisphaerales bacterium]